MARGGAKFRLEGHQSMRQRIARLARDVPQQVERAMRHEAEVIMTTSKREFVPVAGDGGHLRASGHVGKVERSGIDIAVTMSYGGSSAPYAAAVHQHPSSISPPSWQGKSIDEINWHIPGTGPKYLFLPMMGAIPGMGHRIAAAVRL